MNSQNGCHAKTVIYQYLSFWSTHRHSCNMRVLHALFQGIRWNVAQRWNVGQQTELFRWLPVRSRVPCQEEVHITKKVFISLVSLLLWPFHYLGSAHRVFNLRSSSSLCTPSSFICFCTASLHLSFLSFCVHSLQSSMFSSLHLALSFSPHGLTISVSLLFRIYFNVPNTKSVAKTLPIFRK